MFNVNIKFEINLTLYSTFACFTKKATFGESFQYKEVHYARV